MEISDRKIIWGLVALQLAVCLPFINSFPIALDEPFSIFYAQQEIGELMNLFVSENNPPLHFLLLHFWIEMFGISPIAVRSLSLIFSLFAIVYIYKFAKLLVSKAPAILIVAFFVFSRFNHYHALEARTYSLMVLAYVASMYFLYKIILMKNTNIRNVILFSVWNSVLLYSHYLGVFIVFCTVVIIVFFYKEINRKIIKSLISSYLITAVLYIPGLYLFIIRLNHFSTKGTWVPEAQYSELYGNIIRFFNNTFSFIVLTFAVLVLLLINRKKSNLSWLSAFFTKNKIFIILSFIVPYVGMFIFSKIVQPIFLDRYLLYLSPFLYFTFVLVYDYLQMNKKYWIYFMVIIPLIISVKFIPQNQREPDKMVKIVQADYSPGDLIVICPPFYNLTFLYHYDLSIFKNYKNIDDLQRKTNIESVYNYRDINIKFSVEKVFFIDANSSFLFKDNGIVENLSKQFSEKKVKLFEGGYTVFIFSN